LVCVAVFTQVTHALNSSVSNGWVTVCPYGHKTLKYPKVIYLVRPEDSNLKTLAAIAKHDAIVFPFSDVNPDLRQRRTAYCTTCGFVRDNRRPIWTREAEGAEGFIQPLSSLVRHFPLPDKSRRERTRYEQTIENRRVLSEELFFVTTESLAVWKGRVFEWAQALGVPLKPERMPDQQPFRHSPSSKRLTEQYQYFGQSSGSWVQGHIGLISYPDDGVVKVHLSIGLNRNAPKVSIEEAWERDRDTP
jgi:hypothetical protein